jgi:23S rRNA (cytosine1962-C5)-methyltransferase
VNLEKIVELLPTEDAKRIFHGRGGLVPGFEQVNIEFYPPVLWVMVYQEIDEAPLYGLLEKIKENHSQYGVEHVYIQRRHIKEDPVEVYLGTNAYLDREFKVSEAGLSYWVNLGKNQNTGLFLDMVNGRKWVKENCPGKRVLNLFSYTCSLGLAAAAGDAETVVNIDMAKGAIKKGQQNFALNELSGVFIAQDIFKMIKKLTQKGPYDLLIADPPSFQTKAFDVRRDYQKMLSKLKPAMAEGGKLMLCLNSPSLGVDFIHEMVSDVFPEASFVERLENPSVLADQSDDASLKVMIYQV